MELACNRCYLAFEVPEIAQKLRKGEEICTKYVKILLGCREGKDTESSAMQIMLKYLNFNI